MEFLCAENLQLSQDTKPTQIRRPTRAPSSSRCKRAMCRRRGCCSRAAPIRICGTPVCRSRPSILPAPTTTFLSFGEPQKKEERRTRKKEEDFSLLTMRRELIAHKAALDPVSGKVRDCLGERSEVLARISTLTLKGFTPLIMACSQGYTETTKALLDAGANINYSSPHDGATALHHAVTGG